MRQHLDLALDAHFFNLELVQVGFGTLLDPNRGPPDKVGGENGHGFLNINGWFRAHFQAIEVKNLLSFLDPRLNGLAMIVHAEPGRQILGHRGIPKGRPGRCV